MTNQLESTEETKTTNPIQQGELHLSASAPTQVHGERRRRTEEEVRHLLLELVNAVEQILEHNADLYNPSSAGGLQQPSE
jgi:hypothetical protein